MKTYEVIIDLGSKTFMIDAESEEEAKREALREFELSYIKLLCEVDYWVGDISEVKNE